MAWRFYRRLQGKMLAAAELPADGGFAVLGEHCTRTPMTIVAAASASLALGADGEEPGSSAPQA